MDKMCQFIALRKLVLSAFLLIFIHITCANELFANELFTNELLAKKLFVNEKSPDESQVISKFSNKSDAEKLRRSLNKSGQNVRIISKDKKVVLKTVSVGLYSSKKKALAIVDHLKSHNIDAFYFRIKTGQYRVHAGALQHEDSYWSRFEKLLSLGYKRIHTVFKPVTMTTFFVVRDPIKKQPSIVEFEPVVIKLKETTFKTQFLFGRFKGELNGWKETGKQGSSNYFSASLGARTLYKNHWKLTYGSRFEAFEQSSRNNIQKFEFQWLPTYLSYQQPNHKWFLGLIDARWDNRKEESLSDKISSKILTRYLLDEDVIDRRRPIIGARWQFERAQSRLDVIANPIFRPAKLPQFGSIWHPVSRLNRAIRGIRPTNNWQALVEKGSFADEKIQLGGVSVRMRQKIGRRTRATTIQFVRQSEPYYELNPEIRALIGSGTKVDDALLATKGYTFTPRHPYSAIFGWEEFGKISHFEISVSSNTPYTTNLYAMKTAVSIDWVMGLVYPTKDKSLRLSSFFTGRRLNTKDDILERKTKFAVRGEIYKFFKNRHWKIGTDYKFTIDHLALYLNPKINYKQNKYLQLSLYYQLFTGVENTEIGYHSGNSILGLNWQAIF